MGSSTFNQSIQLCYPLLYTTDQEPEVWGRWDARWVKVLAINPDYLSSIPGTSTGGGKLLTSSVLDHVHTPPYMTIKNTTKPWSFATCPRPHQEWHANWREDDHTGHWSISNPLKSTVFRMLDNNRAQIPSTHIKAQHGDTSTRGWGGKGETGILRFAGQRA